MSNNGTAVDLIPKVNSQLLERMEYQIEEMKLHSEVGSLPFTALDLAFEAVRIARFALNNEPTLCKMHVPSLDGATYQLIEALYPIQDEEPQADLPLPEAAPEWLEAA